MVTYSKHSCVAFLVVVTVSNNVSEAVKVRHLQQSSDVTNSQLGDYRSEMLARINKERAAAGLSPLCFNQKLQYASQSHSDDMAQNAFMAHVGSDGSSVAQRITDVGFAWNKVAENVAAGQESVQSVIDAWMLSPKHRENIMGDFTMLGVSHAYNANSDMKHYWTQDFGNGNTESCDPVSGSLETVQVSDLTQVAQNDDHVQISTENQVQVNTNNQVQINNDNQVQVNTNNQVQINNDNQVQVNTNNQVQINTDNQVQINTNNQVQVNQQAPDLKYKSLIYSTAQAPCPKSLRGHAEDAIKQIEGYVPPPPVQQLVDEAKASPNIAATDCNPHF